MCVRTTYLLLWCSVPIETSLNIESLLEGRSSLNNILDNSKGVVMAANCACCNVPHCCSHAKISGFFQDEVN